MICTISWPMVSEAKSPIIQFGPNGELNSEPRAVDGYLRRLLRQRDGVRHKNAGVEIFQNLGGRRMERSTMQRDNGGTGGGDSYLQSSSSSRDVFDPRGLPQTGRRYAGTA